MRVFAALPLPAPAVETLLGLLAPLTRRYPRLRPVKPAAIHITLHFFGELPETAVRELGSLWEDAGMGGPVIRASFGGLGQFPERGTPRVIWVGIDAGAAELTAYAARFHSLIQRLGYAPDPRGFTPHITLARNPGESMDPNWARELGPTGSGFFFSECVLFQSNLSPRGADYVRLRQTAFRKEEHAVG